MDRPAGTNQPPTLASSAKPLCEAYDLALLDLDGVVYRGGEPVAGAAAHLLDAKARGMRLGYVTNNASRTPAVVADQLAAMGIPAGQSQVITSAQAVARLMADALPDGTAVLVVGGTGLVAALREHGLETVASADEDPGAVVQGLSPDVGWRQLHEAAIAVQRGVPWYAANTDRTIPTSRGNAPGNGMLVAAVAEASGGWPRVAGKPAPALFTEAVRRLGADRPLVVGDRLDTDIEGAVRFGADSLLVLTGVTDLGALLAAPPGRRPTFVGRDLAALLHPHPAPVASPAAIECGGWRAGVGRGGTLTLSGAGGPDDALRAVVAAAWAHRDDGDGDVDATAVTAWLDIPARPRPSR